MNGKREVVIAGKDHLHAEKHQGRDQIHLGSVNTIEERVNQPGGKKGYAEEYHRTWKIELKKIPYDVNKTCKKIDKLELSETHKSQLKSAFKIGKVK